MIVFFIVENNIKKEVVWVIQKGVRDDDSMCDLLQ